MIKRFVYDDFGGYFVEINASSQFISSFFGFRAAETEQEAIQEYILSLQRASSLGLSSDVELAKRLERALEIQSRYFSGK